MLQETFGLEGERLWTAASGLGGGMSKYQSVCGALTSGVLALGLLQGREAEDPGPKKVSGPVGPRVRRLIDAFNQRFGAIECRHLTRHDFNAPGGYEAHAADQEEKERCSGYVRFVADFVAAEFSR